MTRVSPEHGGFLNQEVKLIRWYCGIQPWGGRGGGGGAMSSQAKPQWWSGLRTDNRKERPELTHFVLILRHPSSADPAALGAQHTATPSKKLDTLF